MRAKRRETSDSPEKEESRALRMYFNAETQAAIAEYQVNAGNKKHREVLYVTKILPAFEKLAENLINIHKFESLHDSYSDLKNDCVNFLFETIHKFDTTRGTNAFSYFNVVAKNWLIIKTKQRASRIKKSVSLDDTMSLNLDDKQQIDNHNTTNPVDILFSSKLSIDEILELLYEIRLKAKTENELSCINSIITIFENIDEIDILNKSAVLLYIRELSGLSPKQLNTSIQAIKKYYKKIKGDERFKLS